LRGYLGVVVERVFLSSQAQEEREKAEGIEGGEAKDAPAGEKKKLGRVPNMKIKGKGEL
jgi:hypothetical protein